MEGLSVNLFAQLGEVAMLGFGFGLLRRGGASLWGPIALHFANNAWSQGLITWMIVWISLRRGTIGYTLSHAPSRVFANEVRSLFPFFTSQTRGVNVTFTGPFAESFAGVPSFLLPEHRETREPSLIFTGAQALERHAHLARDLEQLLLFVLVVGRDVGDPHLARRERERAHPGRAQRHLAHVHARGQRRADAEQHRVAFAT